MLYVHTWQDVDKHINVYATLCNNTLTKYKNTIMGNTVLGLVVFRSISGPWEASVSKPRALWRVQPALPPHSCKVSWPTTGACTPTCWHIQMIANGCQYFSNCFANTGQPFHLTSTRLSSTHLTSPHLTSPHLTSPHLTSPHLTSPHLTSPHLTSPHGLHCIVSNSSQQLAKTLVGKSPTT